MKGLQTEYEFSLPRGYVDADGNLHHKGVMRLANAMDEVAPMKDLRVKANQAYFSVVLLSRVVTKLGELPEVSTGVIERLFAADFAYLQDFYRRVNENGHPLIPATCPQCNCEFDVEMGPPVE